MAKRSVIAEDIRKRYGNCLTAKQVLEYLCVDYKTGKSFLDSLDGFKVTPHGRTKYLAIDVAAAIDREQTPAGCRAS